MSTFARASLVLALASLSVLGCRDKEASAKATPGPGPLPPSAGPAPTMALEIPELKIRAEGPTKVHVAWLSPEGTAVNEEAPFRVRWNRSDGLVEAPGDVKATGSRAKEGFDVDVTPTTGAPGAVLTGEVDLVVCDVATHAVCVPVKRELELGFVVQKGGPEEVRITIPLPKAKGG